MSLLSGLKHLRMSLTTKEKNSINSHSNNIIDNLNETELKLQSFSSQE
jgi:hypothetical protein